MKASNKVSSILEGLHMQREQQKVEESKATEKTNEDTSNTRGETRTPKLTYDDFKEKGVSFEIQQDTFYGTLSKHDAEKAQLRVDKDYGDGNVDVVIPKGTVIHGTGIHDKTGVTMSVNGIDMSFAAPEDMFVKRV